MVLSEAACNLSMMSRLAASTRIVECGKARQPIERGRDPGNVIFTNFVSAADEGVIIKRAKKWPVFISVAPAARFSEGTGYG